MHEARRVPPEELRRRETHDRGVRLVRGDDAPVEADRRYRRGRAPEVGAEAPLDRLGIAGGGHHLISAGPAAHLTGTRRAPTTGDSAARVGDRISRVAHDVVLAGGRVLDPESGLD